MTREAELARRWLAEEGLTQTGDGVWTDADSPAEPLGSARIAEDWGWQMFGDERLGPADRVRLALGMMDLLGSHPLVAGQIQLTHLGPDGPLPPHALDVLWNGFRRRLEAVGEPEAVTDALWLDWFEDHRTAETAFSEMLGKDVAGLRGDAPEPLLRRARRVLECSGPVPWPVKAGAYRAAATVPALQYALLRAVLTSYHDLYGDLEPAPALALLEQIRLPADTEHLAALRAVLAAGHVNHHRSPRAWDEAAGPRAG
ncbi:hypothetical protein [Streptomyces katrae]|uniref:hypothetical protein n=1 Tax=Streptomyces katrae TaxID=68223 RepID=UPI0004C20592|nr:hypothetical protein [Streptomyces katrae]